MQWVSTFAAGASSLGRPRHLAGRPAESGPPNSQGKIRRELPSLYSEALKRKNVNKTFRRLEGLDDFQCFVQLGIRSSPKGFWRVFDNEIRLNALAFDTFSLPGIPAGDWHSEDVSPGQFE